jgi:hypothetical protein
MIVPVSTISSETAFSLCGRVIEERRRSLTSEHVEMLSLLKDWEQGNTQTTAQHRGQRAGRKYGQPVPRWS